MARSRKRLIGPRPPETEAIAIKLVRSKEFGRSIKIVTRSDISIDVSADIVSHVFFGVVRSMIGKAATDYPLLLAKWSVDVSPKLGSTRATGIATDRSSDGNRYFKQRLRSMIKHNLKKALAEWAPVIRHTRKT